MKRGLVAAAAAALLVSGAARAQQVSSADARTTEDVRRALLRVPYYGVFDFLAFQYDKGTVTLSGFAYQPSLKRDVVRAVRRVTRVDQVVDDIEQLPVSHNDDDIRWATFDRIYGDSVLGRYAPGGGLTRLGRRFEMRRYPGMQPFGAYPIHIIVTGGRTLLLGEVDSTFDRTLAGARAREVPGAFGVENELSVATAARR